MNLIDIAKPLRPPLENYLRHLFDQTQRIRDWKIWMPGMIQLLIKHDQTPFRSHSGLYIMNFLTEEKIKLEDLSYERLI